jgi:hypothetical protein
MNDLFGVEVWPIAGIANWLLHLNTRINSRLIEQSATAGPSINQAQKAQCFLTFAGRP